MISKGTQYLSAAGFGNIRVTAASMGKALVFGTLGWLKNVTVQAILGAFGARDGAAVIAATNAYLNQLAAQGAAGKSKANALAGFINEDPMMVCSLGLEPELTTFERMPVRYVGNLNGAWIDPNLMGGLDTYFIKTQLLTKGNSNYYIFGNFNQTGQSGLFRSSTTRMDFLYYIGSTAYYIELGQTDTFLEIETSPSGIFADGVKKADWPTGTSKLTNSKLLLWGTGTGTAFNGAGECVRLTISDSNNEPIREMYPWIENGVNGLLDVLHDVFYPNANSAGSLTIGYKKYENGQWVTWTPSTP